MKGGNHLKVCKVIKALTSQQKENCLNGKKLLLCENVEKQRKEQFVAVDNVGAGVGSYVLASNSLYKDSENYIDCYIIAILDWES